MTKTKPNRRPFTRCKTPKHPRRGSLKRKVELVGCCEQCGWKFPVTRARTTPSAACAKGDGLTVGWFDVGNGRLPHFFCSGACEYEFAAKWKQQELFT